MTSKFPQRVLIVDDDPLQREILQVFCRQHGAVEVTSAENGFDARRAIEWALLPFDLAIIDLCMPENDGFEFMEYLTDINSSTKLLIISGMPEHVIQMSEILAKIRLLNVIGHCKKPLDLAAISDVVGSPSMSTHSQLETT